MEDISAEKLHNFMQLTAAQVGVSLGPEEAYYKRQQAM